MQKLKKTTLSVICLVIIAVVMAGGVLSGCGQAQNNSIVIYDGQFSEMKLIHQMVKQLVEEKTDVTVLIKDEMAPVNCFKELVKGGCDLMNGYDGTLLTTYLKMDVTDVPVGESIYDFANRKSAEEKGVYLLDKLGINNTYVLAVPQHIADQYNLETISDLIPVAGELVFGAEHEFFSEEGKMKFYPLAEFYGLSFKEAKPIDLGLKYSAVENGNVDVTVVYATDGLNKKANLKILQDDRNYFPEYNGALLVRADLFERFQESTPNLKEVLNELSGIMTDADMVDMTYAVDVEGRNVPEIARKFLQSKNLL